MSDTKERRRIILAAAERLLEHYGMSKTTVADIAREASIGVGSVYLEFGSKDDIIGHVARSKHNFILAKLERSASVEGTAASRLRSVLQARIAMFRELATCGTHAPELIHCGCEPVQKSWGAYKKAELCVVQRLIEHGIEAGEFAVEDSATAAHAVLDAYAAFAPPWQGRVDQAEFDARLEAMHDLVLRGLAA